MRTPHARCPPLPTSIYTNTHTFLQIFSWKLHRAKQNRTALQNMYSTLGRLNLIIDRYLHFVKSFINYFKYLTNAPYNTIISVCLYLQQKEN